MTTRNEVLEIIANGRSAEVDFKRDDISSENLAKELVAFSNRRGGMVILGVEDDGAVSGLTLTNPEAWVFNTCEEIINPSIIPYFEIIRNVSDGKDVAVVHVIGSDDVHALQTDDGRIYLTRTDTHIRNATPLDLRRMFQERGTLRAETQPAHGASIDHLDLRRLRNYFGDFIDTPTVEDKDGWQTMLAHTEFMTEGVATLGGVLLFGKQPNRFLPGTGITAAAFPGTEKDYNMKDRATLRGPIVPLLNGDGQIAEPGMVEQALEFVHRNTRKAIEPHDGEQTEQSIYPEEAVREAIVNALVHRDYLLTDRDIELWIYSDRLEVISPGALPRNMTITRMKYGGRATRNRLIRDTMRDYRYPASPSAGIASKITRGMREHNGTEPELIADDYNFIVRLYANE